ncbi:DUF1826 domain-containing protein [Brevundimonas sp. SORGH_AS_0993]|uniref:DUF1826 domain-containing protein n=1 Tax=Brevundimonas sp. SORGH_AS_0993 TaxID=3041794 RepID=UPI00278A4C0F|nr:DUF1826 domain-containing protein [Brevundimonas sp. SORGH_AS_0993]MDQ1155054.1 hypothetical protein [Brevundimonas sp. SORGH_AS_0993]
MAVGAVVHGLSPSVFTTLFEPQVRLAICARPDLLRNGAEAAPADFSAACDGRWIEPSGPAPDWLLDDIQRLGEILSRVTGVETWRARFETVQTRACPRFHQDAIAARLIVTYDGPGTEWAFESEVADDLDARRAETRARIRRLHPGEIAVLKGTAPGWEPWPDFPAVLHRSPPASRQTPRRVLTLDAV